ncbi:MAG: hypothetical protein SFW36_07175, partial [Leptolyngbyaceae cyanobacterium bins.59]|nr:hypothetical protein [Leptolyngbyaceae cyanobacterium bins.59]
MTFETYLLSALLSTIALASIALLGLSIAEGWGTPAIQRRIEPFMALRRPLLGFLTLIAVLSLGQSLMSSWSEPQIQSRLELYQTNLILHASELSKLGDQPGSGLEQAGKGLLGNNPLQGAIDQYQEVRQSATKNLEKFQTNLRALESNSEAPPLPSNAPAQRPPSRDNSVQQQQLRKSIQQVQTLLDELDVRLGILLAQTGEVNQAAKTWEALAMRSSPLAPLAESLRGLWSDPPQLFPDAEPQFRRDLDGWFRYQALSRLYQLQQRQDVLTTLQAEER